MEAPKLKSGMLIQYRDGKFAVVIGDSLVGKDEYLRINQLTSDLKHGGYGNHCDIMKVSTVLSGCNLITESWSEGLIGGNLLWERPKEIEWDKNPLVRSVDSGNLVKATGIDCSSEANFMGVLLECKNLDGSNNYPIGEYSSWSKRKFKLESY